METPRYSIVIPVYNEQENLSELYRRLLGALQLLNESYEIIFVDDGSHDSSPELIRQIAAENRAVHALFLSRNFGHQAALSAGLDHSRGAAVIAMDADLQDPPELIPKLIARWQQGFQVVYAVRRKRKEPVLKNAAYLLFYRLLHGIADLDIPMDAGDFSLVDRQVVDILRKMPERNRFIRGLRSWIGFRQCGLEYEREARHAGEPKYTLPRLFKLAFDGFLSFSYAPLRIAFWLGLSAFVLCIVYIGYAIYAKFVFGTNPPGWTSLMIAVMLIGGVQLVLIGIMGEYIARIYDEVKQRPFYIVGEKIDGD